MLRTPAATSALDQCRRNQDSVIGWYCPAFAVLFCLIGGGQLPAQVSPGFTPPTAYDIQRYESGWKKNPFTLKTAPAVVTGASFAVDLAVAGISGDSANPTITLVNVKTHERFRLKTGGTAGNGMSVVRVRRGMTHKETVVEVSLGEEIKEIHYDDSYLRRVAAAGRPGAPQEAALAGRSVIPQVRGAAVRPALPENAQVLATHGRDRSPLPNSSFPRGLVAGVGTTASYVSGATNGGIDMSAASGAADTIAPATVASQRLGSPQVISRRVALRPAQFDEHPEPH